jgi:dTMP kinase
MRKAKYLCFEGTEGSGKTTHTAKLAKYLQDKGFKVLLTKEPGTPHAPLTLELRGIMLDGKYEAQMTVPAREFISQAIRSIHIDKVIIPALETYDYIIQDRGILSGLCYGHVCGNSHLFLAQLVSEVCRNIKCDWHDLYDKVIYMRVDPAVGLLSAQNTKKEFAAGDAIEAKGNEFMRAVRKDMDGMVSAFPHCTIDMEGKTVEENFAEILRNLNLGE